MQSRWLIEQHGTCAANSKATPAPHLNARVFPKQSGPLAPDSEALSCSSSAAFEESRVSSAMPAWGALESDSGWQDRTLRSAGKPKLLKGFWWTWSGSNRRPLPCHGIAQTASYRRHSTYKPAQPAKTAQSALFAGKMRAKPNQVASGLVVWNRPSNFEFLPSEIHLRFHFILDSTRSHLGRRNTAATINPNVRCGVFAVNAADR